MSSFNVVTQELLMASSMINEAASDAENARAASASAAGQAGAFDGESIEGTFSDMCSRARSATDQLEHTLTSLARCVQAASEGYLMTDRGILQAASFPGTVGTSGPSLSPTPPVSVGPVGSVPSLSPTPPTSLKGGG
jgi:hypothetical protein